ncbi:hypothetical protein JOF56_008656 [Kibdelosporangium banguiense]|uniref:PET hydrolase/cutinase-like domain-containing protein n=1 Tax=Kibdelosporangium banguiense TaxID=1365924 RepID=A0ABS4TWI7_9PSEU|nr:hypothetical protein [Kibdelosporangium banguiense]MBP2328271.1 hypothetical protein [Kibdelosporangium banguiense]
MRPLAKVTGDFADAGDQQAGGREFLPYYTSLGGPKSYLELAGAVHSFPTTVNPTVSRAIVAFFKRFVSGDNRFSPFVCGYAGRAVSDFRSTTC